jgi:hypothetical protein
MYEEEHRPSTFRGPAFHRRVQSSSSSLQVLQVLLPTGDIFGELNSISASSIRHKLVPPPYATDRSGCYRERVYCHNTKHQPSLPPLNKKLYFALRRGILVAGWQRRPLKVRTNPHLLYGHSSKGRRRCETRVTRLPPSPDRELDSRSGKRILRRLVACFPPQSSKSIHCPKRKLDLPSLI